MAARRLADQETVPYEIHHCTNPACDLRYPVAGVIDQGRKRQTRQSEIIVKAEECMRCGAAIRVTYRGNTIDEEQPPTTLPDTSMEITRLENEWLSDTAPVCGVLDNLRSAFNVGSIFRIADGAGLTALHLCGYTATPAQSKVAKTALGAETNIDWAYHPNGLKAIEQLKAEGWRIIALEAHPHAHALFDTAAWMAPGVPMALVVGNEVTGIDPHLLACADQIVQLPMAGIKGSLNVAVAFGIAAYWLQGIRTQASGQRTA